MYFYVNLSCGEANLDKLGFGKLRVWLFWPVLMECLAFSAILLAVFGLF